MSGLDEQHDIFKCPNCKRKILTWGLITKNNNVHCVFNTGVKSLKPNVHLYKNNELEDIDTVLCRMCQFTCNSSNSSTFFNKVIQMAKKADIRRHR
jgi:hypothetical protein